MEFEKKVVELDVNDVLPNRFQPRIKFNEDSINELCESIKEHGVIQPIVVRAMGDKYEIIAGERRYKASLLAGKQTIPAVITELNDKDSAEVALIENVQRKDLTPIEEAISYKKILDMGYLTQEELAIKLGKNQSTVANKLRLLNLDEEVQEAVLEEKISERHARSLLKIANMEDQRKLLAKIIENRLTVRKTDEEINKLLSGEEDSNNTTSQNKISIADTLVSPKTTEEDENPFKIEPSLTEKIPTFDANNVVKSIDEPVVIIDDAEQLPIINEDQVTVMPTEETNPIKMDEPMILNEVNSTIPSNPIEEAPVVDAPVLTTPAYEEEANINNPGFMDIDKIATDAKDIKSADEKEPVDINSLLKPSVIGTEEINENIPVAPQEAPVEEVKTGKFFSLPVEEAPVATETVPSTEQSADPFAFDITPTIPQNNNEIVAENIIPNPAAPVELEPAISETVSEEQNNVVETSPEVDVPMIPSTNSNEMLDIDAMLPGITQDTDSNFTAPVVPETLSEVPETVPLATEDSNNNLINPNFDFNISAPVTRESLVVDTPEESITPITEAAEEPPKNLGTSNAIEKIRENVKELEKMGYRIDVEEFDFETAYQVVIKIEK